MKSFEKTTYLKNLMRQTLDKAKRADTLHKLWTNRLEKFPLWKRVFLYKLFSNIRAKIKEQEMNRFAQMTMSLALTRQFLKEQRRISESNNRDS